MQSNKTLVYGLALGLMVAFAYGVIAAKPGASTHQPANKVAVSGQTVEFLGGDLEEDGVDAEEIVLSGTMRASNPTDIVISVTAECALWTTVATFGGDDVSEARAKVTLTALLDGTPVGVVGGDDGAVVFCDRLQRQTIEDLDEDGNDTRLENYLATRSANAFNWIALNIGSGIHTIEVLAQLETSLSNGDEDTAFPETVDHPLVQAGVGKRTLIVEPTKLANDVTI